MSAQLLAWEYDSEKSLAAAQLAADAARDIGAFGVDAQLILGQALLVSLSESCIDAFRRARRAAQACGNVELEFEAGSSEAAALQMFGRSRAAIRLSDALYRAASARGKKSRAQHAAWSRVRMRWLAFGDVERTVGLLRAMLPWRALGLHRPQMVADLALALADAGEVEEARAMLARARATADTRWTAGVAAFFRAELEWAAQKPARVLPAIEQALEPTLPSNIATVVRATRLWSLFELDRPEADPLLDAPTVPMFLGARLENQAFAAYVEGRLSDAEEGLLLAARAWKGNVARCELRALWGAGEIALRRGDLAEGRRRLAGVERRAAALSMASVLERAQASLRRSEKRRAPAATGRGSLSPRQKQILQLVGRGRTSQQVGDELGISRRTVETHVQASMRALGASTRSQAVLLARDGHASRSSRTSGEAEALLASLADGATVTEAARRLGVSRRTATRRLRETRERLGVETNVEVLSGTRPGPAARAET
jgi:DNA-binding NarL/FixJ family response regulator